MHSEISKPRGVPTIVLVTLVACIALLLGTVMWVSDDRDRVYFRANELERQLAAARDQVTPRPPISISTRATLSRACGVPNVAVNSGTASVEFPGGCRLDVITECR